MRTCYLKPLLFPAQTLYASLLLRALVSCFFFFFSFPCSISHRSDKPATRRRPTPSTPPPRRTPDPATAASIASYFPLREPTQVSHLLRCSALADGPQHRTAAEDRRRRHAALSSAADVPPAPPPPQPPSYLIDCSGKGENLTPQLILLLLLYCN